MTHFETMSHLNPKRQWYFLTIFSVLLSISIMGYVLFFHFTKPNNKELRILSLTEKKSRRKKRRKQYNNKTNMVLLVLDQWRYDWDGQHQHQQEQQVISHVPLHMPFLSSVALRGTQFRSAYVPTPLCAPSRACLAAGKEYDQTGVYENQPNSWPIDQTTFYRKLRDEAGYHVLMVGKDDLYHHDARFPYFPGSTHPPHVLDLGFSDARRSVSKTRVTKELPPFDRFRIHLNDLKIQGQKGFEIYMDCFHNNTLENLCRTDTYVNDIYLDDFIHNDALDMLSRRPAHKPFFLQVNFAGPHPPNFIPSSMANSVKDRIWPDPIDNTSPNRWKCPEFTGSPQYGGRCSYAAELERLDAYMESIVQNVNLTNTLVCITGDHGEMLGDHNMGGKAVPYQPSISVPLFCMGNRVASHHVVNTPVTIMDLAGTFLEVGGLKPDPNMTTQSLWSTMINSSPSLRTVVHSGLGNWRLVVKDFPCFRPTSMEWQKKI
jgi:arylsulfatase